MSENYVKKYDVGQIKLDLPYANYIHELPLLSFGDVQHTINLSLIFNRQNKEYNHFSIAPGYKLNLQKRLFFQNGIPDYLVEGSGKKVEIESSGNIYTFNDDSMRILRKEDRTIFPVDPNPKDDIFPMPIVDYAYIVENPDYSKEEYSMDGLLIAVYDKYGEKFLEYTYEGYKLTEITYRNTKKIVLYYPNNVLTSITYNCDDTDVCYTTLNIGNNGCGTITHYSGVTYSLNLNGMNYSVTASGTNGTKYYSYKKECVFDWNIVTISDYIGSEKVNSETYTFPETITSPTDSFSWVEIQNHLGVKTRTQFNYYDEPMYSYEIGDTDVEFGNIENNYYQNKYLGSVSIYGTEDDYEKREASGIQSPNDSECMLHHSENGYTHWKKFGLPVNSTKGYCIITGWLKFANGVNKCDFTINHSGAEFSIHAKKYNQWQFFAYKTTYTAESVDVYTSYSPNAVETRDFRLIYVTTHVKPEFSASHIAISNDVLMFEGTKVPIDEAVFYCNGNSISNIGKVHFEDILKYKLNQKKQVNTTEFYCNKAKNIINNVTTVTLSYNGGTYNLNNGILVKQNYTAKGMIETFYNTPTDYLLSISTLISNSNTVNRTLYNEYLDITDEFSEGVHKNYSRTKGILIKETLSPDVSSGQTVDPNLVFVKKYNYNTDNALSYKNYTRLVSTEDEFGKITEYTTDNIWGVVTAVKTPDGMFITDIYDDDKGALLSRKFANITNPRVTQFNYSGGNLISLTHGNAENNITMGFAYDKGKLTNVTKGSSHIEEHEHTDTTTDSYYPTKENSLHSVLSDFDKYGRLIKIDNIVENTYDSAPEYDTSGNLIQHGANSLALLVTSRDLIRSEKTEYHYNEKRQLVEANVKNSTGTVISNETFEYDDTNRLTKDTCVYDVPNSKSVASVIQYEKDETDPLADNRVQTYSYHLNGSDSPIAQTTNGYDAFKRVNSKTHNIGGMVVNKTITYDKTRPESIVDSVGGTIKYDYDSMGRISSIDNGEEITYEYDDYGQLEKETNNVLDKTIEYVYNEIGNIDSVTTYNHANGEPSETGTTVTFDYDESHPDRLTSYNGKTIGYNSMGCPTSYDGKTYTWTRGKLSKVSYGSLASGNHMHNFTYNALGQMVEKSYSYLKKNTASGEFGEAAVAYTTSKNTKFYYDHSGRLVAEYTVENLSDFTQTSRRLEYLYDESGMIGFSYTASGVNMGAYYFQRNLQGDVVAIYDNAGTKRVQYNYDAFGNCTVARIPGEYNYDTTDYALATVNPIRYRGYYFDQETGWYFLNARYYSPEWRRFISPDDTSYLDPENVNGLNLYCYCNNDPVNFVDPSGHESKWWMNALKIAGATLIVATLVVAATLVTGGTATVVLAGAAMGSAAGLIGGGISGGISSVISGGNFWDGFANGSLNGAITGGISGAFAASSIGVWGQVGINMLISGTNYTIANYNNFNWLDFGMNTFIGGLAGFVGGDGWMTAGSTFAYDFALNGVKGSFVRIGYGYLREFADPIIKSTIVGSSTFVTEIIRLMR